MKVVLLTTKRRPSVSAHLSRQWATNSDRRKKELQTSLISYMLVSASFCGVVNVRLVL